MKPTAWLGVLRHFCAMVTQSCWRDRSARARPTSPARLFDRGLVRLKMSPLRPSLWFKPIPPPGTEILHADLYRLTGPDDVIELGLDEAFSSAICLIEWPDRLGPLTPKNAIRLSLTARDSGRQADISFGARTALCAQVQAAWTDNG